MKQVGVHHAPAGVVGSLECGDSLVEGYTAVGMRSVATDALRRLSSRCLAIVVALASAAAQRACVVVVVAEEIGAVGVILGDAVRTIGAYNALR